MEQNSDDLLIFAPLIHYLNGECEAEVEGKV